jgi:PTS system fructose-specific IIA component
MTSILSTENVILDAAAASQAGVFDLIAAKAVSLGITPDAAVVVEGLTKREQQGTTGLMDGIAIPHAKSEAITSPALVIVRLQSAVDWESLDGKPITMAISLLIPAGEAGTTHLKLLSQVARTLIKPAVRQELLAAEHAETIVDLLSEHVLAGR